MRRFLGYFTGSSFMYITGLVMALLAGSPLFPRSSPQQIFLERRDGYERHLRNCRPGRDAPSNEFIRTTAW